MGEHSRDSTPTRRVSGPVYHTQPEYPDPDAEIRPRRHTDGNRLCKVVSRPEDYKNKPKPTNMVEYICFEGDEPEYSQEHSGLHSHPASTSMPAQDDEKAPLNRHESSSSRDTRETIGSDGSDYDGDDDAGYDSEDELTLPSSYHHDVGHNDYFYHDWSKAKTQRRNSEGSDRHGHGQGHHTQTHTDQNVHPHRTSTGNHDGEGDDTPKHRHDSTQPSTPSDTAAKLIQAVAQHLQAHKDAYQHSAGHHGKTSEVINELLGEVVRKVADGGLNGEMVKEVVREVQHVL